MIKAVIIDDEQEQKIILPLIDGFEIAYLKEVVYLKADDNFTLFHLSNGSTKLICRTLKHYEETLNDCGFCRIHRSTIVNLNHITKYNKGKGGFITLNTNEELEVSPSRKNTFLEQMGIYVALGIVAEILFALAKRLGAESPTRKGNALKKGKQLYYLLRIESQYFFILCKLEFNPNEIFLFNFSISSFLSLTGARV